MRSLWDAPFCFWLFCVSTSAVIPVADLLWTLFGVFLCLLSNGTDWPASSFYFMVLLFLKVLAWIDSNLWILVLAGVVAGETDLFLFFKLLGPACFWSTTSDRHWRLSPGYELEELAGLNVLGLCDASSILDVFCVASILSFRSRMGAKMGSGHEAS